MQKLARAALAALTVVLVAAPASASSGPIKRLVFSRKESVYVASLDGAHAKKLGKGLDPVVSPNGVTVAYQVGELGTDGIRLLDVSRGTSRSVLAGKAAFPLGFSHDSKYLAVALQGNGSLGTAGAGLDVIDVATGKVTSLAQGAINGGSFAPSSDTLVYASSSSLKVTAKTNLHTISVTGAHARQITHNGDSLDPVWGKAGIVFDERTYRGVSKAPAYQLFLVSSTGTHSRRLTRATPAPELNGLVPVGVSANGKRLIANEVGEDTDEAYAVTLSPFKAKAVEVNGKAVVGAGISSNGKSLLVDTGFESSSGAIDTVPFGGGKARKLTSGLEPSSNF